METINAILGIIGAVLSVGAFFLIREAAATKDAQKELANRIETSRQVMADQVRTTADNFDKRVQKIEDDYKRLEQRWYDSSKQK